MFINSAFDYFKKHKIFGEFFTKSALLQLSRYLIVGFTTVGIEFSLFYLLAEKNHIYYLLANTMAYSVSFIFNFLMNKFWSFNSKGNLRKQLLSYAVLFFFNLLASSGILIVLTGIFGIYKMLSKVFAVGAVVSWNFILYKKVIYK